MFVFWGPRLPVFGRIIGGFCVLITLFLILVNMNNANVSIVLICCMGIVDSVSSSSKNLTK